MHSRSLNTMLTQQGQHHAEVCVRPTPTLSPQQYGSQSNAPRPHDQCLAAPNFSGGQYEAPSTPRILETRPAILPWTCQPASSTGLTIWGRASPPMDRKRNMDASHGPLVLRSEMTGHAGPMQLGWSLRAQHEYAALLQLVDRPDRQNTAAWMECAAHACWLWLSGGLGMTCVDTGSACRHPCRVGVAKIGHANGQDLSNTLTVLRQDVPVGEEMDRDVGLGTGTSRTVLSWFQRRTVMARVH
jgi:hypothetical protein